MNFMDRNWIERKKVIQEQVEAGKLRAANLNGAKHDYFGNEMKAAPVGYPIKESETAILCPECEGHGGWYSSPFVGIRCSNCNGYGWVTSGRGQHVHNWIEKSQQEANRGGHITWGMHCHPYQCKICGEWTIQDSSG